MNCTLAKLTLLVAFEGDEVALDDLGDRLADMVRQDDRVITVASEYDSVEQDLPMDMVDDDLAAALDQQFPSKPQDTGFDRLIAKLSLEGVNGITPLLPDPAYSQDVALVAFLIDQLRAKAAGPHVNVHGQTFTDEDLKRAGQDWGDESPNEWAIDNCHVCGKRLGEGWRIMHVGLCESCRNAPTS